MRHLIVGTAGHIDHGKSTLVMALTGTDPDRLKEEKARGITIDLGFAHWQRDDLNVAFVDVPGHERFIKNMLAGVGGIDAVLLVVAADEGVMPQTREHLDICRLLAVPRGVIAITKADLVDPEMLELVQLDVGELVSATALSTSPVIAVSARTGMGMAPSRTHWHRWRRRSRIATSGARHASRSIGCSRCADSARWPPAHSPADSWRLTIPSRSRLAVVLVKVRGVQVHGERRQAAVAGERVAVNLTGVEVADLMRGQVLATPGTPAGDFGDRRLIDVLPSARPLKHGARVRFHHGTAEILARVSTVGPASRRRRAHDRARRRRCCAVASGGSGRRDTWRPLRAPSLFAVHHRRRGPRARPGATAERRTRRGDT